MPFAYVNGTILHYESTGTGTPLIFIHPPLLTSQAFAYQKEQLSGHFRVITFDIRGHGASNPSQRTFTYALIVEDICRLMDYLGIEKAYLCGYSTGGSVVLEGLLANPQRFLGGIVVSGMSELTDVYNKGRVWLASRMAGSELLLKLLQRAVIYGNADKETTYRQQLESAKHDAPDNVKAYLEQSLTYSCTRRLARIEHPVLLIYGQKDHGFHRYANMLHEKLPHSSLYFLKDAKHQIPFRSAPKMNDLIRLWVESLEDVATERVQLDRTIARKLNPAMYGEAAHEQDVQDAQD
ncbi:alpha/beta hydrolase [Paenibacillus sp. HWE-109]|uniref:alpha/beta fold hydrolase n=1 Tax=Paenibacillus sp. HWE-109 TaxID=1306526 RepID=UPI001EDD11BA|nr:alpha/beta hydrolase [Paenibacillus sp. HWE-109]UKS27531.1 alpha/beta hydrolase [Paenibacillus sp. HWE-109]